MDSPLCPTGPILSDEVFAHCTLDYDLANMLFGEDEDQQGSAHIDYSVPIEWRRPASPNTWLSPTGHGRLYNSFLSAEHSNPRRSAVPFAQHGYSSPDNNIPPCDEPNAILPDPSFSAGQKGSHEYDYATGGGFYVPAAPWPVAKSQSWAGLPREAQQNRRLDYAQTPEDTVSAGSAGESDDDAWPDSWPPSTGHPECSPKPILSAVAPESPMPRAPPARSCRRNATGGPAPSGIRKSPTPRKQGRAQKDWSTYDLTNAKGLESCLNALCQRLTREKSNVGFAIMEAKELRLIELANAKRTVAWTARKIAEELEAVEKATEVQMGFDEFKEDIKRQKEEARKEHRRLTQGQ
jgi:hypothetical protein